MTDLLAAFGLVALAELGDKTQLLAVAFATRHRAWQVLVGIAVAATLVLGVAAVLGGALGQALPERGLALGAGVLFLGFAVWTWRDDDEGREGDDDGPVGDGVGSGHRRRSVLITITVAFVVAELGDKTMLATAALAATRGTVPVWVGAAAGMTVAAALGIAVGRVLGHRLPADRLRLLSAAAFAAFGLLLVADGLTG